MPVEIGGFQHPSSIQVRATGAVTLDEARHALAELLEDSRIGPGTSLLIDARGATRALPLAELASIAFAFRKLYGLGVTRLAVVTDRPEIETAARIFGTLVATVGASARAFEDPESAGAWLSAMRG
jgi:hypothetical protein